MKQIKRTLSMLLAACMCLAVFTGCADTPQQPTAQSSAPPSSTAASETAATADKATTTVTILQSGDIHGFLNAHDYAVDAPVDRGLSRVATLVRLEREIDPNLILMDTGDIIQGNMIESFRNNDVHPAAIALNSMRYDSLTPGNHEFNFEYDNLTRFIDQLDATFIAANIYQGNGERFAEPYLLREVGGVRVAIIGLIAPHVPVWETADPTRYNGMTFSHPVDEMEKMLGELEGKADLIIVSAHDGREPEKGVDALYAVADAYGDRIDAIFHGHEHSEYTETRNGVLFAEPGTEGTNLMKATFTMEETNGVWSVVDKQAELLSTEEIDPDPAYVEATREIHEASVELANRQIGTVGADFMENPFLLPGIPVVPLQDTPLMDLINTVQMINASADVSMAAGFNPDANLEKGPYLQKDGVKVYKYDNTLYGVTIKGSELKKVMEMQAGDFFNQWQPGDVTISFNPEMRFHSFDMFAGLEYDIDVSQPSGERIVNVMYKGAPLDDNQELILALNNHRYGNLKNAGIAFGDITYDSFNETVSTIRDMVSAYVSALDALMPACDNNWKIIGADLDDPQKDEIYAMIRSGEIVVETSEDGRTPNVKSINADELREMGVLQAQTAA